jgi:hypothetical protein
MNPSMQPAIQHLFQVSTLEAVSREQLETFVEEYPCFGFGHYLLSRKLRAENAEQFLTATQKTSLYFSNPFWLQWMLENAPEPNPAQIPAEPIHLLEPPFVPDEQEQPAERAPITATAPSEPSTLHADPGTPASAAELLLESIESARALRESLQKINEDYQSHTSHPELTEEATIPHPLVSDVPIQDEEPPFVLDEPDQPAPAPAPEPPYTESSPVIADSAPPPVIADSPTPPIITESTPLFEPLHTIDYFASQGIRLTLDENPTDPLGRQLKSFTEWLRTMRRLPQKDREIVPDRVAEQNIQNIAAHSIEGKEPITETMAEVLAKQGMPERARIVYEKLSLLNPEKSAYFAAKIEQLNTH